MTWQAFRTRLPGITISFTAPSRTQNRANWIGTYPRNRDDRISVIRDSMVGAEAVMLKPERNSRSESRCATSVRTKL